jgi:site-specific DNA-methyltransferase (adenine-specific)/site-specific DNA-methyltransferase (cytosine-N4-specific)
MERNSEVDLGDCKRKILQIPDGSVSLVLTSPPYAMQRKDEYGGIEEKDYPAWFTGVLELFKPKMRTDGNVIVNIRSHVHRGSVSDFVLRTRLAIREAGWIECEELLWYKSDGGRGGSIQRPRRTWEHLLWYSLSRKPYTDLKACGKPSDRLGGSPKQGTNPVFGVNKKGHYPGIARITDIFTCPAAKNQNRTDHPAVFPIALCEQIITTFCPPGGFVVDPFAGSASTLIAAQKMGRRSIGFENLKKYFSDQAKRILKETKSPGAVDVGNRPESTVAALLATVQAQGSPPRRSCPCSTDSPQMIASAPR